MTSYDHHWPPGDWSEGRMHQLGDLALFLGGSETSFTGDLLRLMRKADPGNRVALASAFPDVHVALVMWEHLGEPTFGSLARALTLGPNRECPRCWAAGVNRYCICRFRCGGPGCEADLVGQEPGPAGGMAPGAAAAAARLVAFRAWADDRDELVRSGRAAGLSKAQIHRVSGLARSTLDRILGPDDDAGPPVGNRQEPGGASG